MITASRWHTICTGHRVVGQGGKCEHLHGHEYVIHFEIASVLGLNNIGMVLDFGVIKTILCEWLEQNWDHKFLVFIEDPWLKSLAAIDPEGVTVVPFNPTAENMAHYLLTEIGPNELAGTGAELISVTVEETKKCSATAK